jgi:hypothetical protein
MKQTGGVYTNNTTTTTGDTFTDNYNVTGPITIETNRPTDFYEQLKMKYRATGRR